MDAALRWPSPQIRRDLRKLPLINSVVKIKMMRQAEVVDKMGGKLAAMQHLKPYLRRYRRPFVQGVKKCAKTL
jgi:hypothetical protein